MRHRLEANEAARQALIDIDWLREAYRRTRKDVAVGVDGQSGEDSAMNLEGNLRSLLERAKSGTYQAPPVRRVHIPNAGSATETRPPDLRGYGDMLVGDTDRVAWPCDQGTSRGSDSQLTKNSSKIGSPTANRASDAGLDLSEVSELAKSENHHIYY